MTETLTKRDLINIIYAEHKGVIKQSDILNIVQRTIDIMSDTLASGDRVVLRNFGTLHVKEVKAKVGRNPKNPTNDVHIPARMVVKFKVGKELKERVASL